VSGTKVELPLKGERSNTTLNRTLHDKAAQRRLVPGPKEEPLMTIHIFELQGCTEANLPAVHGSLVRISNCTIHRTAKGIFLLSVEADDSFEGLLQAFLAPLHVTPIRAMEVPFPRGRE